MPDRDLSSYENPPTITNPSNSDNFSGASFHKNSTGFKPARWQAMSVSRSVLEPGNWIIATDAFTVCSRPYHL